MAKQFGRSAERYTDFNDKQGCLFDEAELDALMAEGHIIDHDTGDVEVDIKPHKRKTNQGKRKPLPDYLPREIIEYHLTGEDLVLDNGAILSEISSDTSEQLEIILAMVKVIQYVRYKYAVKGQEELGVYIADMPTQPIAKSIASSGLLAHIVQSKFCYHLPLYRQQQIWQSMDIELSRSSMCRWMLTLGEKVQPVIDEVIEQMKLLPYMQADETTVTVINDNQKKADNKSHKGYMWAYNNPAGVVYDYQSTRHGKHPRSMLDEFEGYLQTDAYSGYNDLFKPGSNRTSVGCWAHARRKYVDVIKALGKNAKAGYAHVFVKKIAKLYAIESKAKEAKLSCESLYKKRQSEAVPILHEIKLLIDEISPRTPAKSLLGKALTCSKSNWTQLCRYTETDYDPIDNNDTERKVKPFTVGRKNWLFSGNTKSAKGSANLFSMIENAKLYQLKVFEYLKYVFDRIGNAKTDKDFEQLTPKFAQAHVPKNIMANPNNSNKHKP